MDKIPFTAYDFFGNLAAGFTVLVAIVAGFDGYRPLLSNPGTIVTLLLIVVAYTVGQIVANLSGDLIERRIVRHKLGMPTAILMRSRSVPTVIAKLFPGYSTPLPERVCDRIRKRASGYGVDDTAEALFLHCHAIMKSDAQVQTRLSTFLNIYGFCRNMALALIIVAVVLAVGIILGTASTGPDVAPVSWLIASLLGAVGLFYRYLKFLRQFGFELLTSYAEGA